MSDELNIVSIYCKICLNCNEQPLITDFEKTTFKNHVSELFNIANKHIGDTNRIILTTDSGAAIAYTGLPTDAMLVAKDMLNAILITNIQGLAPLSGRVGIHLKPVRMVNDFEDQPNIIGDVFKVAKQLITKAKANQILVSRPYYDNLPPSIQAFSTLFYDPSMEHDSHVLAYQAYLSNLRKDQAALQKPTKPHQSNHETPKLQANKPRFKPRFLNASNWVHTLASLFIIVGLFSVAKLATTPSQTLAARVKNLKTLPIKASQSSNQSKLFIEPEVGLEETSVENIDLMQEEFAYSEPVKTALPKKIVKQKTTKKINSASNKSNLASKKVNLNTKRNELVLKRNENKQLNTWETFKHNIQQGGKKKCTQPEIAMNQCQ